MAVDWNGTDAVVPTIDSDSAIKVDPFTSSACAARKIWN